MRISYWSSDVCSSDLAEYAVKLIARMIDAGDARGADCLPVDRADRARGVRPGAEIVVDDVDRRSPGALPYLGELRTGVVEDVIDDLHTRIRREIEVRITVAIVREQSLHED